MERSKDKSQNQQTQQNGSQPFDHNGVPHSRQREAAAHKNAHVGALYGATIDLNMHTALFYLFLLWSLALGAFVSEHHRELIEKSLNEKGRVKLLVTYAASSTFFNELGHAEATPLSRLQIEQRWSKVQPKILSINNGKRADEPDIVVHRIMQQLIPVAVVTATREGYQQLLNLEDVQNIEYDGKMKLNMAEATDITGAKNVRTPSLGGNTNYDGRGWTVAVLDDGFSLSNPFLQNKAVGEACFADGEDTFCPNGDSSQSGPGSATPGAGGTHGTHVAGTVLGNTTGLQGIAPGATLLGVNIFGIYPNGSAGEYNAYSSLLDALIYVHNQTFYHKIAAVSLSIGSSQRYDNYCDRFFTSLTTVMRALRQRDVAIVIAAGNSGFKNGIAFPACMSMAFAIGASSKGDNPASFSNSNFMVKLFAPGVDIYSSIDSTRYEYYKGGSSYTKWKLLQFTFIYNGSMAFAIGASSKGDNPASFSNSNFMVKLFAPGVDIYSSIDSTRYEYYKGTSMACPVVSGAFAVYRSVYGATPTSDSILKKFQDTGRLIVDPGNGRTFPRIDLARALWSNTSRCGNSVVDEGESCDDGNLYSGDGCTSRCEIEPLYYKNGTSVSFRNDLVRQNENMVSVRANSVGIDLARALWSNTSRCGNSVVDEGESCDDGNLYSGDGCTSRCEIEPLYYKNGTSVSFRTDLVRQTENMVSARANSVGSIWTARTEAGATTFTHNYNRNPNGNEDRLSFYYNMPAASFNTTQRLSLEFQMSLSLYDPAGGRGNCEQGFFVVVNGQPVQSSGFPYNGNLNTNSSLSVPNFPGVRAWCGFSTNGFVDVSIDISHFQDRSAFVGFFWQGFPFQSTVAPSRGLTVSVRGINLRRTLYGGDFRSTVSTHPIDVVANGTLILENSTVPIISGPGSTIFETYTQDNAGARATTVILLVAILCVIVI
ncbi:peptidase S8 and S53 subtilisin kexin sedolisin [Planoprotostelium fungivorum]|uniref:Peptidase S8 and S53 subtilisin kexin sedolisin n=1 Tax=Planoprotostelium fungivorum TaxID=1890364 RepID=A0A2P6MZZ0_9EUKA|nr:peptidase S8 and S53 subtilisin kexin sedolisin [Planoprotostelium fungivorum]